MALVLYVYLPSSWNGEESCLTVSRRRHATDDDLDTDVNRV